MKRLLLPLLAALAFSIPIKAQDLEIHKHNLNHKGFLHGGLLMICLANAKGYLDQDETSDMLNRALNGFDELYKGNKEERLREAVDISNPIFDALPKCLEAYKK